MPGRARAARAGPPKGARPADLAAESVEDLLAVPHRAVADTQHVLTSSEQVGHQFLHRADCRLGDLLDAARHLAVHRVEHLALASIDHGHDHAIGVTAGEREEVERRDPDHGDPQRLRDRLRSGEADAHSREQTRADVDGHHADLGQLDVGLTQHEVDRRDQGLDVTTALGDLEQPDDPFVPTNGHADAFRGRLDAENQHANPSHPSSTRLQREAQDGPTAEISTKRTFSSAASVSAPSNTSRSTERCTDR